MARGGVTPPPTPVDVVAPTADRPRPVRAAVLAAPPTRKPKAGEKVCGECGEPNRPARNFCARCGVSLAEAQVVKTPWWRKVIPHRRHRVIEIGGRPGRQGVRPNAGAGQKLFGAIGSLFRTVMKVGGVLILVGGLVYGGYSPFRDWVNKKFTTAQDKISNKVHREYDPVRAVQTTASAQDPKHAGTMADDGYNNTYWQAPSDKGAMPELTLTFQHPVTLNRMIVQIGAADAFNKTDRPSVLHLVYPNGTGEDVQLKDTPDEQTVEINHGANLTSVVIQVTGFYRSAGATSVAITEIQLFGKDKESRE
ncbi:MAG: hypothetical protein AUG49_02770 [Catenulispora sp. 13_1_20CM_3_70_7]|nr:MAG: hypothetical protein AUG49_02770 [Catenulispora sp. 13_1_20CM_3_70_7]